MTGFTSKNRQIYQLISLADQCVKNGSILFVGSGFTKAFCPNAPLWGELLRDTIEEYNLSSLGYNSVLKEGKSYPAFASDICKAISNEENIKYEEAERKFKRTIGKLTSLYPDIRDSKAIVFRDAVDNISPSYIVTTNYDLCIESILGYKSKTFEADDIISKNGLQIPVYHIHGSINKPETIVITQEDYIKLLRPGEYRQASVPVLLSGATTLFVSYSVDDINVKTYIDWCKNVYHLNTKSQQFQIVYNLDSELFCKAQLEGQKIRFNFKTETIIETDNVIGLLHIIGNIVKHLSNRSRINKNFEDRINALKEKYHEGDNINSWGAGVENLSSFEEDVTRAYNDARNVSAEKVEDLTRSFFNVIRATSQGQNNFHWYGLLAASAIGVLKWNNITVYPQIFVMAVENLYFAKRYAGKEKGQSYLAMDYLDKRENLLPLEVQNAIKNFIHNRKGTINPY